MGNAGHMIHTAEPSILAFLKVDTARGEDGGVLIKEVIGSEQEANSVPQSHCVGDILSVGDVQEAGCNPSHQVLQEEEELQLALALSQSEAEEKERMVSGGSLAESGGAQESAACTSDTSSWSSCRGRSRPIPRTPRLNPRPWPPQRPLPAACILRLW